MFLDLRTDSYLCIDSPSFTGIAPWLHGWPRSETPAEEAEAQMPEAAKQLARDLTKRGILSESPEGAKEVRPVKTRAATVGLRRNPTGVSASTCCLHALPFFYSCALASWKLKTRSMTEIVDALAQRKRNSTGTAGEAAERARTLRYVSIFNALRLFYPREYLCMFDSVALLEFLNIFNIYPEWVFGVRTDPFVAHCWVQSEDTVLNDTTSKIDTFEVIMWV